MNKKSHTSRERKKPLEHDVEGEMGRQENGGIDNRGRFEKHGRGKGQASGR